MIEGQTYDRVKDAGGSMDADRQTKTSHFEARVCLRANGTCMAMQKAQPLICDACIFTSSSSPSGKPLFCIRVYSKQGLVAFGRRFGKVETLVHCLFLKLLSERVLSGEVAAFLPCCTAFCWSDPALKVVS